MHGTVVGHGTDEKKGRSGKVQVMMITFIMARIKQYVRATPILAEDYLWKEMSKANRSHVQ